LPVRRDFKGGTACSDAGLFMLLRLTPGL